MALAMRIPGLLRRHTLCSTIQRLPLYPATSTDIPDIALNEAAHVLGILAYSYVYEQQTAQGKENIALYGCMFVYWLNSININCMVLHTLSLFLYV